MKIKKYLKGKKRCQVDALLEKKKYYCTELCS